MPNVRKALVVLGCAVVLGLAAVSPAMAGAHTWVVNEAFSNADGTIQFVEIIEPTGGNFETGVGGAFIVSNTRSYDIPSNVASPTGNKTILFGTLAFCALFNQQVPGNPTCDFTFSAAQTPFLSTAADSLRYSPYQPAPGFNYTAGQLPTDGINSRTRTGTIGPNTPKNYAGQTGTVNAAPPPGPAGVPDGTTGTPMTGQRLDAAGTSLSVAWDTATCSGETDHQIIYGDRSNLPAALGGAFGAVAGVCSLGATSPYQWDSVPEAGDGSGLLWWLIVVKQNTDEGSWGDDSLGERVGPGAGGSSGQCGVTNKSVSNACGH